MNEKTKSILAYIFGFVGGLIVLLGCKNNERNTKFHAAQSIVSSVGFLLINILYNYIPFYIPFFSTVVWAFTVLVMILGIVKACKNEDPEIPIVGSITKSIFGKMIDG